MSFNDFMEGFLPCLFVFILSLIFFGFVVLMRYLHYKETVALAEKGLVRPKRTSKNGQDTLRWGIIITALGLALCIGIYPFGFVLDAGFPFYFGPWMLIGLLPTFFGLGLILIYYLTRQDRAVNKEVDED